ncbi:hypothetical protein [Endozoicomonas acroporae]|uniref:hypothetical protein n=1 Tax=Endozoicomonas acroporae TaxID=1701104 RepID=UPI003D796678
MYQTNQFPSYDASFYYLCSSALGIVDQEQQFGATEQQPIYQGIPVQVLNPIPTYNNGPDIYQNEANHSYSLNKYNITSLTNFDSENASGTGIPEIPQSILDEYVPYQPEYKPVNNALLLTPNTPFQQLISWDELEREQTTANHTNSGLQLTNLPAGIHSSQDLRPVAVVNPLYMHQATTDSQTTQAEVNVDGSSSLVERKRERKRKRYHTDPAYAERQRERKRKRYHTDPAYAEREKERQRELRKDPVYTEGQNIYNMIYRKIKRQTSNKEEAKELAVIARARYLQSVHSDKNSGDLPLTSNLAETSQSSAKNLDSTAPPLFSRQTEGIFTVPIEPISP